MLPTIYGIVRNWAGGCVATDEKAGSVAAGTTFNHTADCAIEFVINTIPSSNSINLNVRIQDSSNYWTIRNYSNGKLILWEVVAGGFTQRASKSSAVSGGERIVVIANDEIISVYYDGALAFSYSSAANFKTETNGELEALGIGGTVSDIISWPLPCGLVEVGL